jgi:F0F1-type ATP synthase assembly protein I
VFWGAWEIANAALATFAPYLGARMVGWNPVFGWNSDVLAMSQQYGMTMFLLGFAYLLAATNPVRYAPLVWVAVGEQVLGILIGFNDAFVTHAAAPGQFLIFVIVNSVIAAVFIALRPARAPGKGPAAEAHKTAAQAESVARSRAHAEAKLPT